MPHFGIVAFDTVGLALVGHGRVQTRCVDQLTVSGEEIAVIEAGLRRAIHSGLQSLFAALTFNRPDQNTTRGAVNQGHDIDFVFSCPPR